MSLCPGLLHLSLFVSLYAADATQRVQRTGIADEGEVAGDDGDEHILVVAHVVVACDVAFQLRLASTLGSKEAESNFIFSCALMCATARSRATMVVIILIGYLCFLSR